MDPRTSTRPPRLWRAALAVAGTAAVAAVAMLLYRTYSPFFVLFLLAVALAATLAAAVRLSPRRRAAAGVALFAAGILAAALAVEGGALALFALRPAGEGPARYVAEGYDALSYFTPDPLLGYAPRPDTVLDIRRVRGDLVLYDVTYHIGRDGLRRSADPAVPPAPGAQQVLFFGCSFTFGEGLEDEQTLPWRFAALSDGAFVAHDFAFHGYGPQQMLAILESGRERAALDPQRETALAVYSALLPEHVDRAVGATLWDTSGPRWVPSPDGDGLVNSGPFRSRPMQALLSLLLRSIAWRHVLVPRLARPRDGGRDPAEEEIFVRIIGRARTLFESRYNGRFLVVLWGPHGASAEHWAALLAARGIASVSAAELIPDYAPPPSRWFIAGDGHPSALANEALARALLARLPADAATERAANVAPPLDGTRRAGAAGRIGDSP